MGYPQQGHPQYQAAGNVPVVQVPVGYNMKRRHPVVVWLVLPIVTLLVYYFVWPYKVHKELHRFDPRIPDRAMNSLLSMIFGWITLFVWPAVMWWKLGGDIRRAQSGAGLTPSCSQGLGLLLVVFGFGDLYYQIELNRVVDRYGATPPGAQVSLAA